MQDVIVVGGGASGLMCAMEAGARGLDVLVLEKGPKVGLKILVSGGGRCNFTNLFADPKLHYLSQNPYFCVSAMRRYEPEDFLRLVEAQGIAYHAKTLGQLFCDHSAKEIVSLLVQSCDEAQVEIRTRCEVVDIRPLAAGGYELETTQGNLQARQVVLASGGLSLPKIASDLAFRVAQSLSIPVVAPRPALVPLTWNSADKERFSSLSGISLEACVTCGDGSFLEQLLFTHRGLSGPAMLQASSYWREGDALSIDLLPQLQASDWLLESCRDNPQQRIAAALKTKLPNRLVDCIAGLWFDDVKLGSLTPAQLSAVGQRFNAWSFKPGGSEGYRTAEVTLGGIDTNAVSSKTFELKSLPGLYAIGEALDVTGWLGGYNFQWAWASGWCCAQHLKYD
jgi:predicted Rossmann fold flavoprotein